MAKIRVFLTDDHTLFRQGTKSLITAEPDMEVVGEASNANEALDKLETANADVVLLDIGMPGLSSFEAARKIRRLRPQIKLLFVSMYDDEDYLTEAMAAGADGYVLKDSPVDQLLSAIRDINQGGSFLSSRMLMHLVDDFRCHFRTNRQVLRSETLTAREKEVLKMLAEGSSVKEIAVSLNLSLKTIETHKFNLMRKLGIHNKAQLVQYAIQRKVIRVPVAV